MADERKNIFIDTVEELFKAYPMNVPAEAFDFFEKVEMLRNLQIKELQFLKK